MSAATYIGRVGTLAVDPQTNGLVTGNIGAVDPDGDPLTYTVIGTPHNGGTLESTRTATSPTAR
jgi:hypothetical protein